MSHVNAAKTSLNQGKVRETFAQLKQKNNAFLDEELQKLLSQLGSSSEMELARQTVEKQKFEQEAKIAAMEAAAISEVIHMIMKQQQDMIMQHMSNRMMGSFF